MPQTTFLTASCIVALGGGLGAWLRYCTALAWSAAIGPVRATDFPYATLTVNIFGSLAMGLLVGWLARGTGSDSLRLFLAVGVLGGFTTFSAFSLDIVALFERGQLATAFAYSLASVVGGVVALFLGLAMMRSAT